MADTIDEQTVRDLLPAYALGSLAPGEAAAVRAHLQGCRACTVELAELEEVAGHLALAATDRVPPPDLEARILEKVASRETRGRSRPFVRPLAAAIAAAVIVALGALNVILLTKLPRPGSTAPLVTISLSGTSSARGAYGTIVLDMEDNRGVLAVSGLAPLSADRRYQLWIIRGEERLSGGLFSVTDDGYGSLQITVPRGFTGFTSFGISIEPAGGSAAPTGARVMSGRI